MQNCPDKFTTALEVKHIKEHKQEHHQYFLKKSNNEFCFTILTAFSAQLTQNWLKELVLVLFANRAALEILTNVKK